MKRREFLTLLGCATSWPITARAQQLAPPVIGFLHGSSATGQSYVVDAFKRGLNDTGYIEGQNLTIEYRWANGQYDRLPSMVADLIRRPVAVLATVTPVAALAAKRGTSSIPIVFTLGSDPVKDGLVDSLNRPASNITGATFFSNLLIEKRLELLHELAPHSSSVALLLNPKNANAELENDEAQAAARALGLQFVLLPATNEAGIDEAFVTLAQHGVTLLLVSGDVLFNSQRMQIAKLAAQAAVATSFANREQAEAGGLMSYGASLSTAARQAGNYVGRILKGAKPSDLPVQEPTKFEFVINLKTAKLLRLSVPASMQSLADKVIE